MRTPKTWGFRQQLFDTRTSSLEVVSLMSNRIYTGGRQVTVYITIEDLKAAAYAELVFWFSSNGYNWAQETDNNSPDHGNVSHKLGLGTYIISLPSAAYVRAEIVTLAGVIIPSVLVELTAIPYSTRAFDAA